MRLITQNISLMRLNRWLKNEEFVEQISAAKVARKLGRLKTIEAGGKTWTASAWLMERSEPEKYSRPEVQLSFSGKAEPVPHAYFLAGESNDVIKGILDSVPVELSNTPQSDRSRRT